MTNKEKKKN